MKPICVVKVNKTATKMFGNSRDLSEVLGILQKNIGEGLEDYHVLAIPTFGEEKSDTDDPFKLQVFYDKDFTEKNLDELKAMVKEEFKKLK